MKITIFNRSIIYQRAIFNSYVTNYRKVMEEFWANHELMTRGLAEQPEGTGGSGLCLGFAALVPRVEPPGWVVGPPEIVCLKKKGTSTDQLTVCHCESKIGNGYYPGVNIQKDVGNSWFP